MGEVGGGEGAAGVCEGGMFGRGRERERALASSHLHGHREWGGGVVRARAEGVGVGAGRMADEEACLGRLGAGEGRAEVVVVQPVAMAVGVVKGGIEELAGGGRG